MVGRRTSVEGEQLELKTASLESIKGGFERADQRENFPRVRLVVAIRQQIPIRSVHKPRSQQRDPLT
jgi:hypothetical protein